MEAHQSTATAPGSGTLRHPDVGTQGAFNGFPIDVRVTHAVSELRHGNAVGSTGNRILPIAEPASQPDTTMEHTCDSKTESHQGQDVVSEQDSDAQEGGEDDIEGHVPLTYQIPEDKLRAAMLASPNTRASYYSTKLYRGPSGESLSTHYCQSMDVAERVAQYFLKEKVVGFDIEWKPRGNPFSIKQNTSLIQLACENRIALFHISLFPGKKAEQLMPPSLRAVLESPDIYKVGVAIKGDFTRLEKYLKVKPHGVFELSRLHNLVEWYAIDPSKVSNRLINLAAQVLQHLQLPLYKGEKLDDDPEVTSSVRESDWSLPLDFQQIQYAAADAYAGFRLYHILEWKRKQLKPIPPAVRLCDYDNKPVPKPKKPKPTSKAKDVVEAVTEQTPSTVGREQVSEGEDGEDVEGYETAPEELMDSHQLEEPAQTLSSKSSGETDVQIAREHDTVRTHRRVGRVDLPRLRGPDPEYPGLPQESNEQDARPSSAQLKHSPVTPADRPMEGGSSSAQLRRPDIDVEDDAFADPELEEVLKTMDLDTDGKLREKASEVASEIERSKKGQTTPAPPLAFEVQPNMVVDHAQVTTPTFEPLIVPSEKISLTPEYDLATTWAQDYLRSTVPSPTSTTPSRIRATVPHLRAYHLWRHQKLSLGEVAGHLRTPPMSDTMVTSYIVQAITLERLDYEKESLKELMMTMPSGLRQGRWKWLAEQVGALH